MARHTSSAGVLCLFSVLATASPSTTYSTTTIIGHPPLDPTATPFPVLTNVTNTTIVPVTNVPVANVPVTNVSTVIGPELYNDTTVAATHAKNLTIVDEDPMYRYYGCYSETSAYSEVQRALQGPSMNVQGHMTVPICLHFCGTVHNVETGERGYSWAGLEFAQECWCGDHLSTHSYHIIDAVCDIPCAGDNKTACGGNLALTLYKIRSKDTSDGNGGNGGDANSGGNPSSGDQTEGEAMIQAVGVGLLVLTLTFALGFGFL
ncbi:hypothetical protein GGR54DRAFT_605833 [Hypoxylon sp. NC1633]|nr:hypothetical protein GGR54DRAFT_605833 [Hypoxylon sp. NC1633]